MNRFELTLAGAAALLPTFAAADKMALRTGLWELSFTSQLTSDQARQLTPKIPEELLAEITASQRAEFRRLYESGELLRNSLNTSDTLCITEEDLERGIRPATDIVKSCTVLSVTTHKASQEVQFVCDRPENRDSGKAVLNIAVSDPTRLTGSITRSVAVVVKPFSVKVDMLGEWLDSQCGEEAQEEDEARLR